LQRLGQPSESFDIHEDEDEPLLFTMAGCWGCGFPWNLRWFTPKMVQAWRVFDAASCPLGSVHGMCLGPRPPQSGAAHSIIAAPEFPWETWCLQVGQQGIALEPEENELRIGLPSSMLLGTVQRQAAGIRLSFATDLAAEPFVKMLLLATVIAAAECETACRDIRLGDQFTAQPG
jgi:hypothetical protein